MSNDDQKHKDASCSDEQLTDGASPLGSAPEEVEDIDETLEILSNPKLMKELKKAEKEIEEGKGIPWEQVQKELGLGKST